MSDYIHYMDLNLIKLGDLANEIGDYTCAIENYSKAIKSLNTYPSDSMLPMMKARELKEKIKILKTKKHRSQSILFFETWKLTKSSFVKGSQCTKYLYLDKHKKQEKTPISKEKQAVFDRGHHFEDNLRKKDFPDGKNIKNMVGNFAYFNSYTKHLLNSPLPLTLYEATIIENDVLVMCDVLRKDENGGIDIYEIKLNKEINEAILNDLSVQYMVCKQRFGNKLNSFNLALRVDDNGENWSIENYIDLLEKRMDAVKIKTSEYKEVLLKNEPKIAMGTQCNNPYECEFIDYCKKRS